MDHEDLTQDIKRGLAQGHRMRAAAFAQAGHAAKEGVCNGAYQLGTLLGDLLPGGRRKRK